MDFKVYSHSKRSHFFEKPFVFLLLNNNHTTDFLTFFGINKLIFFYSPDGHHSECDILRRHVVRAFNFVDLIGFGHDNTVML